MLACGARAQDCDPLDVYIVMDKSASISNADSLCLEQTNTTCWEQLSSWAKSLYLEMATVTGGLYDGEGGKCDGLRLSLIIYSNLGIVVLPISGDAAAIEEGFERLDTVGVIGGTDPAEAFRRIIELQNGDAISSTRPQSVVYLTDGRNKANAALKNNDGSYKTVKCSTCKKPIGTGSKRCIQVDFTEECVQQSGVTTDRTKQAVATSKTLRTTTSTEIFAVGVGEDIDFEELEKITASGDNVFTAKDTNSIQNIVGPLAARTLNLFEVNFDSGVADPRVCAGVESQYAVTVSGKSVVHLEGRSMRCAFSGMEGIPDANIPAETTFKENGDVEYLSCKIDAAKVFWPWSSTFTVSLFIEADAGTGVEDKRIDDFQVEIPSEWCFGEPSLNNADQQSCFGGSTEATFGGLSLTAQLQGVQKDWKCVFNDGKRDYETTPSFESPGRLTCSDPYPVSVTERLQSPKSLKVKGKLQNDPKGTLFTFYANEKLSGATHRDLRHLAGCCIQILLARRACIFHLWCHRNGMVKGFFGSQLSCEHDGTPAPAVRDGERLKCILSSSTTSHDGKETQNLLR